MRALSRRQELSLSLAEEFAAIDAMKMEDLAKEVVRLHRRGTQALFTFSSGSGFQDATQVIGEVGTRDL